MSVAASLNEVSRRKVIYPRSQRAALMERLSASLSFIPINLDVLRAPANADDIDPAVPVQIGANQIFATQPFRIENSLLPLLAGTFERMEDINNPILDSALRRSSEANHQ